MTGIYVCCGTESTKMWEKTQEEVEKTGCVEEKQDSCGMENTKKWSKTVKEVEKTGCVVNTACSSFGMKLA